jgi:peptidoglycan-associated lipoprotein
MAKNFKRVFFELDQVGLDPSSKSALDENVRIMTEHPDIKVELQGHADERGTTDYNLALGQRRANAVRKYMVSTGVGSSRLKVVSYGEERPLSSGSNENAWSKNRRAEFVITWGESGNVHGTAN